MDSYFSLLNLSFVENCHISIFTTFGKQSMINRLSNAINRNRSAAKISKVMSSSWNAIWQNSIWTALVLHRVFPQVPKWVGEPDSVEPKPNPTPLCEYQMCQIFNLLYSEKKMTGRCFVGGCNLIWDKLVTLPIPLPPTAIERFPGWVWRISKTKSASENLLANKTNQKLGQVKG